MKEEIQELLIILKGMSVEPPIFLLLSLLGVYGYEIPMDRRRYFSRNSYAIDRDNLFLPEIIIEAYDLQIDKIMKPVFHAIWNAAGWPHSFIYDDEGNWKGVYHD